MASGAAAREGHANMYLNWTPEVTVRQVGITPGQVPTVSQVAALLQMALNAEWVGQVSSSQLWGSNLYLGTVAHIARVSEADMWEVADQGQKAGAFSLNGSVLCRWRPQDGEPSEVILRIGVADGHVEAVGPKGSTEKDEVVIVHNSGGSLREVDRVTLTHQPVFGYDTQDIARIHAAVTAAVNDVAASNAESKQKSRRE